MIDSSWQEMLFVSDSPILAFYAFLNDAVLFTKHYQLFEATDTGLA